MGDLAGESRRHGNATSAKRGVYYLPLTLADRFRAVKRSVFEPGLPVCLAAMTQPSPTGGDFGSVYLGVHSCSPTCKPSTLRR